MIKDQFESNKKIRVLLADDEESFLGVVAAVLELTNRFQVYACNAGDEAVEELKRSEYDVIILDYRMPGMSGLNVLQWMHEQKLEIPTIMLTGAGSENIAVEAMKLGAYDYVRKDHFDREHFPLLVHSVYERFLFKKERERQESTSRELEKQLHSLESLKNSLAAMTRIAESTLQRISLLSREGERLLEHTRFETRDEIGQLFKDIRNECDSFSSARNAMAELSVTLAERIAALSDARNPEASTPSGSASTEDSRANS
jgi:DNA-binding response OmpR family regulator